MHLFKYTCFSPSLPTENTALLTAEPQRSFYQRLKGWTTTVTEKVTATGTLGTTVYYNIVRDLSWTYLTYNHYTPDFRKGDDWTEANNAQWFYGTGAMIAALLPHYLVCRASSHKMPWATAFISIAAASLAIPGWNIAAKLGSSLGEQIGMSATSAGYFSGLFTGLAEGPIQETITSIGQYIIDPTEKAKYAENPGQYFIQVLKRLLFSATFGSIPGDAWQLIYNAGKTNQIGSIPTSLSIATGVAFCNVMYDKFKNAALLKTNIQKDDSYQLASLTH